MQGTLGGTLVTSCRIARRGVRGFRTGLPKASPLAMWVIWRRSHQDPVGSGDPPVTPVDSLEESKSGILPTVRIITRNIFL